MHKKTTKPKSAVWNYYFTNDSDKLLFSCKFCYTKYTRNATRMQKHLIKCLKCPQYVKEIFLTKLHCSKSSEPVENNFVSLCSSTLLGNVSGSCVEESGSSLNVMNGNITTQSCLNTNLELLNVAETERLDELFARAIYSSGTPLSITESSDWIDFIKSLKPSYSLPSRLLLSNRLLEAEYHRVEKEVSLSIKKSTSVGLQCYGWSNRKNECIVSLILTTPKPFFYKAIALKEEIHTGEYIAQQMEELLNEIGIDKCFAIVINNGTAIVKAGDILQEKYPHISVYSCAVYTLNLFVLDILKSETVSKIEFKCKQVVKTIVDGHALRAKFHRIQKEKNSSCVSLKLPVKTGWESILACFQSLLDTKNALKTLALEEGGNRLLEQKVNNIILDENGFWVPVDIVTKIFMAIVKWIKHFESDDPKISVVSESFKCINASLTEMLPISSFSIQERNEIIEAFEKRKSMAIKPIHLAANLLDPKFRGESLNSDAQIQGSEFIDKLSSIIDVTMQDCIFKEFAEYRAKEGFFAKPYVNKSAVALDPIVWWKGTCYGSSLGKLAVKVLSMPVASAATEKSFSTYGFVHSAKRNRLTVEKAGMLTYVAHNLKLIKDCGRENKIDSTEPQDTIYVSDSD